MSPREDVSPEALERFQRPRNYGPLDAWDGHARITGPCGDTSHRFAGSPAAQAFAEVVQRVIAAAPAGHPDPQPLKAEGEHP